MELAINLDLKRAAEALRQSERRYERLLASVTDYVYSVTIENGRVKATVHGPGCEAVTGYARAEFEADTNLWYTIIMAPDRAAVLDQAKRILGGQTPPPIEHRIRHKNGCVRWIRNTPVPRLDSEGAIIAYDGLVSDITERKDAEEALRQSQERLALVISGTNDGIWDWDIARGEVYYSPRWKSMLGYEDHEIPNQRSSWEQLLHPEDRARVVEGLNIYLAGHTADYQVEHRMCHKDRSYRWILARGVALRDAEGRPVRMAGSHVDLTERKQAEELLLRAQITAAKFEAVGTLAAGVAHEVKNPLQTITLGLDYLDHPGANGDGTEVLGYMREAAARASTIIGELLGLAAPETLEMHLEDWNVLIERSLWLVNFELVASKIEVVCHLAPDLPMVNVNHQKMQQVLVNLIINSIQAMNQGGTLTITTRMIHGGNDPLLRHPSFREFSRSEPLVLTEVLDTGPGIDPAHLARLFDPFFTTKPVGKGTGLGLAVVKKIVDLHAGAIDIRNAPQGGAQVGMLLRTQPPKKI